MPARIRGPRGIVQPIGWPGAIDRARPPDGLDSPPSAAYPSGHAAYSVFYVWAAVTIAMMLEPKSVGRRLTTRGVVIAVGVAIAAAVGLSRVYLRVHYLSDVSGGWALGATAFALCGMFAILVVHLRHNEPRAAPAAATSES